MNSLFFENLFSLCERCIDRLKPISIRQIVVSRQCFIGPPSDGRVDLLDERSTIDELRYIIPDVSWQSINVEIYAHGVVLWDRCEFEFSHIELCSALLVLEDRSHAPEQIREHFVRQAHVIPRTILSVLNSTRVDTHVGTWHPSFL
ncbi:hypothetical protein Halxa_1452 [Halopiger xanaduensis SH-6]|uniref:Uncharacterized protein n=1 Tax=Halopiger xanaduensis (strain DSM 18323 / JCM 14033 / SH-6) TaxID=797210 RepID=F8D2U2_HALXS|nr:hypothetical protein Halxa_1452 [Halopiger xanaduensis SH-6]